MFLSRIPLDISNRNTLKALSSPSKFHGALESCFPGKRERNLWRLDSFNGQLYFLALTETLPDFSGFCQQFAKEGSSWEIKSYDSFLKNIRNGDVFHFRLTANPTKKISHGRRVAHITEEHQKNWLIQKTVSCGFSLSPESFNTVQNQWYHFTKCNQRPVSLLAVTYEGILKVTDAEQFRSAMISGIGHGKAYGMGLLTVVKIKGESA